MRAFFFEKIYNNIKIYIYIFEVKTFLPNLLNHANKKKDFPKDLYIKEPTFGDPVIHT